MKISAARAFIDGAITPATIEIDGPRIIEVRAQIESGSEIRLSEADGILIPGLIDLQLNGAFGVDFQKAEAEDFEKARRELLKTGVTGFLATLVTASHENILSQLSKITISTTNQMSDLLGVHLEGPYIAKGAKGTHEESQIREINLEQLQELASYHKIKLITLAPELENALAAIDYLTDQNIIVSLGHSLANGRQAKEAVVHGASMVTHIFNAQSGVHHRETGLALEALINPKLFIGVIADLHHLSSEVLQLIFQTAPDRAVLVTDAIAALGMEDGLFQLGDQNIVVKKGSPPKRQDGVIAGSAVRLDESIANLIKCGIKPELAIKAATTTPAKVLGVKDRGEIKKGYRADMGLLTDAGLVSRVWHQGEEVAID